MGEDLPPDPNQVQPSQEGQPDPRRPRTSEELTQDLNGQLSKPDSELAIQGIDNQIADVEKQQEDNDWSVAFRRGYKPTHPGPAPHPEAGGMDHEDYNVA